MRTNINSQKSLYSQVVQLCSFLIFGVILLKEPFCIIYTNYTIFISFMNTTNCLDIITVNVTANNLKTFSKFGLQVCVILFSR